MKTDQQRSRETFMRAARAYVTSLKPSDETTHFICGSFAEMIALDRDEVVTIAVGKAVIRRDPIAMNSSRAAR